jgi:glycosyltransferase involved in cell wall biosynthesis
VPHSYNTGIKAATGDAVVFCEGDDEVAPGWLKAMGEALMQHEFVVCRLEYHKLNEPWRLDGFGEGLQTKGLAAINYPPYLPVASGCTFGFRRSLYDAIGELHIGFRINHDVEYCWRAQRAGIKIHFVPDAVMHYRLRHDFAAMYRQGISNGSDFTLVRKYYSYPIGKLDPVRKLLEIIQSLPKGAWLFLKMQLQVPHARGEFGVWYWHFGYAIGTFQGLLKEPPGHLNTPPIGSLPQQN